MDTTFPQEESELMVCKKIKNSHCLDQTKCMLGYIGRASNSYLCVIDFQKEEIIVNYLEGFTIAGFPTEVVRNGSIEFYNRILSDDEKEWLRTMVAEAGKILLEYDDFEMRMELVFSFDLLAKNPNGTEVTLHHRLVPYQLDKEGNIWLALCCVSALSLTYKTTKACIDCVKTGDRYDFIDGKFVKSRYRQLVEDEIAILGYLAQGMAIKQISGHLGMSLRAVERKKKEALDKLGAQTQAAAVYRAKDMGLI
ncbi:MAG: LuxR C-terminal-related transcriptional regulator [Bacteroidales bacterium]|nr:LuxR C-terminal-related transcriptional regulator [Bacteroidales bacterium]